MINIKMTPTFWNDVYFPLREQFLLEFFGELTLQLYNTQHERFFERIAKHIEEELNE